MTSEPGAPDPSHPTQTLPQSAAIDADGAGVPRTDTESVDAAARYLSTAPQPCPRFDVRRAFAPGERYGDFEVVRVLGAGAFAQVYLARQLSLDRLVALKVSLNRGTEARTLAGIEHAHIVRVFSEVVDPARDLRLLCMQYVPGTTLERVIGELVERGAETWSGRAILETVDALSSAPVAFDPAAVRDREELAGCDFSEAVCWLGGRLAEALAHAHSQGVLHRDLKPANVLVDRYGRPLLADFNVASDARGPADEPFGGTLAYMAPEHLAAFDPDDPTPRSAVDERSDIFSLGVVLFELAAGERPFMRDPGVRITREFLRPLADERRAGPPPMDGTVQPALARVIRRCLHGDPAARYQTGAELAAALAGCRDLRRVERHTPPPGRLTVAAAARPFLVVTALVIAPHLAASVVNIAYNMAQIVTGLTPEQQATFDRLVIGYNAIVYPLAVGAVLRLLLPVVRGWRAVRDGVALPPERLADVRRRVLSLPAWAMGLSCAGWLPGAVLFPLGISVLAGPLPAAEWGHFAASFTVAGLIALTYSYLGAWAVVLRVLYPGFWVEPHSAREGMAAELAARPPRLRLAELLAGSIPLAGALLIVGVGPDGGGAGGDRMFRVLLAGLISLGIVGFAAAMTTTAALSRVLAAMTGDVSKSVR